MDLPSGCEGIGSGRSKRRISSPRLKHSDPDEDLSADLLRTIKEKNLESEIETPKIHRRAIKEKNLESEIETYMTVPPKLRQPWTIKEKNLESEIETHMTTDDYVRFGIAIKEKNLESEIETLISKSKRRISSPRLKRNVAGVSVLRDQREESRVRD